MSGFEWGLAGASLLLAVYALKLLFGRSENQKARGLGCGFALVAAAIWSFAFGRALDSTVDGARLGVGLMLVLSSLSAVARPAGGRIALSVVSLMIGLALAGPVLSSSWKKLRPSASETRIAELEEALSKLEREREGSLARADALAGEADRVRQSLLARGHADFAAAAADPAAEAELRELALLLGRRDEALAVAAELEPRLRELEDALRRLRALAAASDRAGDGLTEAEIRALEAPAAEAPSHASTVEEHMQRKELEALFEREIQGKRP